MAGAAALALLATGWLPGPAAASRRLPQAGRSLLVIALPEAGVPQLLGERDAAWGIGVFPDSRSAEAFWGEVAAGSPARREGPAAAGARCALRAALERSGRAPALEALSGAPDDVVAALGAVFCAVAGGATAADVPRAVAAADAEQAARLLDDGGDALVLGVGPSTPVFVGLVGEGRGLLDGGIARRPGIVTPYDLTATIVDRAGASSSGASGSGDVLEVGASDQPETAIFALAGRLVRDAGVGPGISAATVPVLLGGGIMLAFGFYLLGAPTLACRTARGGAAAVGGYVATLFVPSGNATVRAIPLVAAYVIGVLAPAGDAVRTRRQIGLILGVTSAAIGVLTIAAAARPGGEPALGLWGNPLESWRFFGLRNHLAAMLQVGALAGVALAAADAKPWAVAAAGLLAAGLIGAPVLGANFVAVLTVLFGAGVAAGVLRRGRVDLRDVAAAGVASVAGFALALLSDAGPRISHGGRAVERIRESGFGSAIDAFADRWGINVDHVRDLWGGPVWAIGLAGALVALAAWSARDADLSLPARAVVAGGSAAALAALVLEDTGFFAGGIIALAPGLVAVVSLAGRLRPLRSPAPDAGG